MKTLILKDHFFKFIKHELVFSWLYMFVGGMLGAFLIFILNLYLARNLSYSSYGIYVSLLSLYTLLTIPAGSLTATIVHFAAKYLASGEVSKAKDLYLKMSIIWLLAGFLILVLVVVFNPVLLSFLHIEDATLMILVGLTVGITYFGIVNNAFIQSLSKFLYLSFASFIGSISRLSIALVLVVYGFGVTGAMLGLLSFPLVILILGFIPLLFLLPKKEERSTIDFKEIAYYAIPVSIGLLAMSSFITSDVILVKHFFSSHEAGLYGGLSVVGKVIFYFTASIPSVMFPIIVRKHTKGEDYKNTYFIAFSLVAFLSLGATIFYFLFPDFTLRLFLGGNEYLKMGYLLGLYGIYITIYNLLSLTVSFFLSIKKIVVSYITLFFCILQITLIFLFHSTFSEVILVSIISSSLLLATLLIYFFKIQKA